MPFSLDGISEQWRALLIRWRHPISCHWKIPLLRAIKLRHMPRFCPHFVNQNWLRCAEGTIIAYFYAMPRGFQGGKVSVQEKDAHFSIWNDNPFIPKGMSSYLLCTIFNLNSFFMHFLVHFFLIFWIQISYGLSRYFEERDIKVAIWIRMIWQKELCKTRPRRRGIILWLFWWAALRCYLP